MVVLVGIVLVDMGYIEVASSFVVDFAIVVACDNFVENDTFVDCCNYYIPLIVVVVVVVDLKQDFVCLLREMVN